MAEWARADRPPLRRRSTPTGLDDAERDRRRDGHDRRQPARRRRPPARAQGRPVGAVAVTSFRPFPADAARGDPRPRAKRVAVVERTDEPAASGNPLTREIKAALADLAADGSAIPRVVSASAGLGSRDVAAGDLVAVFDWLRDPRRDGRATVRRARRQAPARARRRADIELRPRGAYSLRGHSIGGFGSVTTNKLLATLVGELFGLQVQAYPRYGSEKRGLPTTYYLTIAEEPIRQHGELRPGRLRAAPRRRGVRPGRPAGRPRRRRHALPQQPARRIPTRSGRRSRPRLGPRSSRASISVVALDTARARASGSPRRPSSCVADAGRRARRGLPARRAVRGSARPVARRAHGRCRRRR